MMNHPITNYPFVKLNFRGGALPGGQLLLKDFSEIITTIDPKKVVECLERMEEAQRSGHYVAGFVSYEAARALDSALITHPADESIPLIWFGVCKQPIEPHNPTDDLQEVKTGNVILPSAPPSSFHPENSSVYANHNKIFSRYKISKWKASMDYQEYSTAFSAIKKHLIDGDTYQLNLTFPMQAEFSGDIYSFYEDLRGAQQANYCAWINTGDLDVLSISPELFFQVRGDVITTRPMKGTRERGKTVHEDSKICRELAKNSKDRAENVMIVDLLRNDLGRIACVGSVSVPGLFNTEIYPTIVQMTSSVQAKLKKETTLTDIFKALFPSGSIVGAPKVKTMELITRYEPCSRGVYCGAVGYLNPNGEIMFNVAIRTLVLKADHAIHCSIGSGLVADSGLTKEYNECLLKSKFLERVQWPKFQVLETLLFEPGTGFYLLIDHLVRMMDSAAYFGFKCNLDEVKRELSERSRGWNTKMKVRLLLNHYGDIDIQDVPLNSDSVNRISRVAFAKTPVMKDNLFLYHKTTYRLLYEKRLEEVKGVDDVILFNANGEVTESTIANIAVIIDDQWYTPPVSCGLLAGTKRAELLRRRKLREKILTKEDVLNAKQIKLFNSVSGEYNVKLVETNFYET